MTTGNRSLASILAFAIVLAAALPTATGQSPPRERTIGIGSVLGGGLSYNVVPTLTPPMVALGPQADFGTLEVRFFLPRGHSIDLYSQVGNTVISAIAALGPRRTDEPGTLVFASLGALYNLNLGEGRTRALLAIGLEVGGDYGAGGFYDRTRPVKVALRIPARIGVERLVPDASLGLLFMLRPFFEVVGYGRNDGLSAVSPGAAVLAEIGIVFYPGTARLHPRSSNPP